MSDNAKFYTKMVMVYGGLTVCAIGIEGVAAYSGLALGIAIHGVLLAVADERD